MIRQQQRRSDTNLQRKLQGCARLEVLQCVVLEQRDALVGILQALDPTPHARTDAWNLVEA